MNRYEGCDNYKSDLENDFRYAYILELMGNIISFTNNIFQYLWIYDVWKLRTQEVIRRYFKDLLIFYK